MSAAVLHPPPDMSAFRLNMIATLLSSPSTVAHERVMLLSEKIHLLVNSPAAPSVSKAASGCDTGANRTTRSPATPGAIPGSSSRVDDMDTSGQPHKLLQGLSASTTPETVLDVIKTRLELARVLMSDKYGAKYIEAEAELMQVDGMCRSILKRAGSGRVSDDEQGRLVSGRESGREGGWEAQWLAEVKILRLQGLKERAELELKMGKEGRAERTKEHIKVLEQER